MVLRLLDYSRDIASLRTVGVDHFGDMGVPDPKSRCQLRGIEGRGVGRGDVDRLRFQREDPQAGLRSKRDQGVVVADQGDRFLGETFGQLEVIRRAHDLRAHLVPCVASRADALPGRSQGFSVSSAMSPRE